MPDSSFKLQAALQGLAFVRSGMIVGLGAGSTAVLAVRSLGEKLAQGALWDIRGIPCSREIEAEARRVGIPLTTLEDDPMIDLTIDGADEVDPALNLIKGGGGALLREKIVAAASACMVVIADQSKCVGTLGQFPLPIEVVTFGLGATRHALDKVIGEIQRPGPLTLRHAKDGHAFVTDGGHWILDAALDRIDDPAGLAHALSDVPGVMEHGLFVGMAQMAIIGGPDGVKTIERS
jgi:ribose 5-phosphate isomerase A